MEPLFTRFNNVVKRKYLRDLHDLSFSISEICLRFQSFLKDSKIIVYSGSSLFVTNTANISFSEFSHDLHLPIETVLGNPTVLGSPLLLNFFCF